MALQEADPIASDHDLMLAVRQGDSSAFEKLYEAHRGWIHAYLWRTTGDAALSADLTQEVFLRVWRDRERWEPSGNLRGYFVRIARRLAVDESRRNAVRSRWAAMAEFERPRPPDPETMMIGSDHAARVHAAIRNLPDRMREVFLLKRHAGLSYLEIAKRLNISPKTVDVQMSRALRRLRDDLADLLE